MPTVTVHHRFTHRPNCFVSFQNLAIDPANPTVTIGQLRTLLMQYEQLHVDQIYTEYTIYAETVSVCVMNHGCTILRVNF